MKEEIEELLRDRFSQVSNTVFISLQIIFSLLAYIRDNNSLFVLGLYIFVIALITLNSIYILIAQKSIEGVVRPDKQISIIQTRKFPKLRVLAKVGLLISFIMIVSGFFIPSFQAAFATTNTPTPTTQPSSTAIFATPILSLTPTETLTPIQTSTYTATATFTITPTYTPTLTATATTNPMVFRGLDQGCLSRSLWTPYFYNGESEKVDSRNCWDLTGWGVIPQNNGLSIVVKDSNLGQDITRRLYTKIKGDTEIVFTIRIDQITTKMGFDAILMMGVGNSSTVLNTGYYLKYTSVENEGKIYREVGSGLKTYYDPRSEYTLGESQNIIIRITGTQAKIIADGVVIQATTLSPDEHSVFWIVYSLPSNNGSLIAEISDFHIFDNQ